MFKKRLLILSVLICFLTACSKAPEMISKSLHDENNRKISEPEEAEPDTVFTGEAEDGQKENTGLTAWDEGPETHGQLRVENGILTDRNGQPFQLRGMSTHGICWYPNYINAGAMSAVRSAAGNVMRIAMYTQADGGYLSEPDRNMNLVIQAVENARAMDMYVIVDWHILDDGDPNTYLDRAITFFDAVASRYPKDPGIIYEVCNEPNGVKWDAIEQYAYAICPVIRQYSPDAVIILGTPDYSSGIDSAMEEPFPQDNILYAYHFYAGEHGNFSVLKEAVEKKFPVMVSEWGIGKDSSGNAALQEGREFVQYLNENEISWCAWSLCNKDEVYSVLRPECEKLSQWQESDLSETGKVVFAAMGGGTQ